MSESQKAAEVIVRLAGLVRSGLGAQQALAEVSETIESLPSAAVQRFQAVWRVANRVGGSLSAALDRLAEVFADESKHRQEIELAFAGPRSTARLVLWLPVVSLVLAQLLGMRPFEAVFHTPLGFISVAIGVILMLFGRVWSRAILSRAQIDSQDPGLPFDLVNLGLSAGLSVGDARIQAAKELKLEAESIEDLDDLAEQSRRTGAQLSSMLSTAADLARQRKHYLAADQVARLGVRLMIPIGVLVLPAFVLMAIVPLAISLLSSGQM
jgi:tight adherence protein B